jgi:glutamine amidotransferase
VLFADLDDGTAFYFVHSYHLVPTPEAEDRVTTTAWHGDTITASVRKDHIFGVQFHPEKSQAAGLKLYENFVNFVDGRG